MVRSEVHFQSACVVAFALLMTSGICFPVILVFARCWSVKKSLLIYLNFFITFFEYFCIVLCFGVWFCNERGSEMFVCLLCSDASRENSQSSTDTASSAESTPRSCPSSAKRVKEEPQDCAYENGMSHFKLQDCPHETRLTIFTCVCENTSQL